MNDPLSAVLGMLEVGSSVTHRIEASGRWAWDFPACPSDLKFGGVLSGPVLLRIDGMAPVVLEPGDCYLLTSGLPFAVASVPPGAPQNGPLALRDHRGADGVVRPAGPEADTTPPASLASGGFTIDED
ncbi:MAG: AraC family transcriptional regulator, partial [Comamonadaceae bacterium]